MPSSLSKVREIEDFTEKIANEMAFSDEEKDSIAIAVTEMANNAIIHGNQQDRNKNVTIRYHLTDSSLTIAVKDEGKGFDPDQVNNPLAPENLLKESGRGIFIVRALMDEVSFNFDGTGTSIKLIKRKSTEKNPST
ncbi:ATP-binding protein [candidate division KSB1 bacterium]|nr:ATP-binding protein [candidate division KSB1 bacterium]